MKIFHNPRCRKSRETLQIIEDANVDIEIIEYLKTPPTKEVLKSILLMLDIPAEKLVRKSEQDYKDNFKGKSLSEDDWVNAMIRFPKLMERPIVISNEKAILGRPPENVKAML